MFQSGPKCSTDRHFLAIYATQLALLKIVVSCPLIQNIFTGKDEKAKIITGKLQPSLLRSIWKAFQVRVQYQSKHKMSTPVSHWIILIEKLL